MFFLSLDLTSLFFFDFRIDLLTGERRPAVYDDTGMELACSNCKGQNNVKY